MKNKMTDLKNNLEEVWNDEYKDFMLSFYPESSPLVSTWEIYRMAKIKSQKEIKNLLELTETLNQIRDNLQDENRNLSQELQKTQRNLKLTLEALQRESEEKEQLEQELQKTREQLEKAERVIQFYSEGYVVDQADWDDDDDADCVNTWSLYTGKRARQYFKDKQGE